METEATEDTVNATDATEEIEENDGEGERDGASSEGRDTSGFGYRDNVDAGDVDGTPGGVSDRGRDREIATPRIVTSRPDLTATADPEKVPERLQQHLREHQIRGAALAIQAMDTQGGFLLADKTGAGKSRQLLAIAHARAAIRSPMGINRAPRRPHKNKTTPKCSSRAAIASRRTWLASNPELTASTLSLPIVLANPSAI